MRKIIDKLFGYLGYYRVGDPHIKVPFIHPPEVVNIIHKRSEVIRLRAQFEYSPYDRHLMKPEIMDHQIKHEILKDIGRFINVKDEYRPDIGLHRVTAELLVCEIPK